MSGKKKFWLLIGSIAVIIAGSLGFGYYEYTEINSDPANSSPEITVAAPILFNDFKTNEEIATHKYFNRLTCTRGKLKALDKNKGKMASLAIEAGDSVAEIFCQLDPRHAADLDKLSPGDSVEVKGICAGLLTDVLLVGCSAQVCQLSKQEEYEKHFNYSIDSILHRSPASVGAEPAFYKIGNGYLQRERTD